MRPLADRVVGRWLLDLLELPGRDYARPAMMGLLTSAPVVGRTGRGEWGAPAAAEMIRRLAEENGPLMFHQSGGCCDGSSPMCFPQGDFITGDSDQFLGELEPVAPPTEDSTTATVDGYTVTLEGDLAAGAEAKLTLNVTRDGEPVTDLEPYRRWGGGVARFSFTL